MRHYNCPSVPDNLIRPVLISIFGTPSALTHWGIHLLRTIMRILYGNYHFIHGNFIDDLRNSWGQRDGKSILFVSECPDTHISDLYVNSEVPIFIFADDPVDVAADIAILFGVDAYNALRLTTRSFSALNDVFRAPTALCTRRRHYDRDVASLVEEALDAFGVPAGRYFGPIMQSLLIDSPAENALTVGEQIARHFPHVQKRADFRKTPAGRVAEDAARAYEAIADGLTLQEVEWAREIFLCADSGGEPVSSYQELVGPARFLIYGPYMHLPRGQWIVRVEIEVSENYSGNRLQSEVVSADVLSTIIAELPAEGVYAFEMQFQTIEPLEPVEIRFQLQSGAIEGKFLLRKVTIRRAIR